MKTKIRNFTSAQQKLPSKNNPETTAEILNTKCVNVILKWQNTTDL